MRAAHFLLCFLFQLLDIDFLHAHHRSYRGRLLHERFHVSGHNLPPESEAIGAPAALLFFRATRESFPIEIYFRLVATLYQERNGVIEIEEMLAWSSSVEAHKSFAIKFESARQHFAMHTDKMFINRFVFWVSLNVENA